MASGSVTVHLSPEIPTQSLRQTFPHPLTYFFRTLFQAARLLESRLQAKLPGNIARPTLSEKMFWRRYAPFFVSS